VTSTRWHGQQQLVRGHPTPADEWRSERSPTRPNCALGVLWPIGGVDQGPWRQSGAQTDHGTPDSHHDASIQPEIPDPPSGITLTPPAAPRTPTTLAARRHRSLAQRAYHARQASPGNPGCPLPRVATVCSTMWPVQERQRTVIVIASGLGLALVAATVNRLLSDPGGGWFAYAPNTGVAYGPGVRTDIWRDAGIWLGALAVWTGLALWLFRHPRQGA
jgi:hypothetical protein